MDLYSQTRMRTLQYLFASHMFSVASDILEIIGILNNLEDAIINADRYIAFLGMFVAIAFLLFIDNYEKGGISIEHLTIAFFVLGSHLTILSFQAAGIQTTIPFNPSLKLIPFTIFGLLLPIFFIYVAILSFRVFSKPQITPPVSNMKYVLIFYFVLTSPFYAFDRVMRDFNTISIIIDSLFISGIIMILPKLLIAIGAVILYKSYLAPKDAFALQLYELDYVMVYDRVGLLLFSAEISSNTEKELFAGAISAITSLMQEAIGTETDLDFIALGDKQVIMENRAKFVACSIVGKPTIFLKNALNQFTDEFQIQFEDSLENFDGRVDSFASADKIVERFFGVKLT